MTKTELVLLIEEAVIDVLEKNEAITEGYFPKTIELAVKLSCMANFKLLQKLGILDDFSTKEL